MKKIIVFAMLMIISVASFSQQTTPSPVLTKQDYLLKSKNQKTTAWVLLGGGASLILLGDLIGNGQSSSFSDAATGVVIGGAGLLCMLGSIPEFIASAKNKRRAMSMSFKNEAMPQLQNGSFVIRPVTSLSLKINL
ncbi:MAG TPA: hypothetical protein VIV35_00285 [Chitinophagaceae bacterium]